MKSIQTFKAVYLRHPNNCSNFTVFVFSTYRKFSRVNKEKRLKQKISFIQTILLITRFPVTRLQLYFTMRENIFVVLDFLFIGQTLLIKRTCLLFV